ncbi:MAG: hypothetical protein ABEJ75_03995 [Candidatus Nanohaloarchaea archaeon]
MEFGREFRASAQELWEDVKNGKVESDAQWVYEDSPIISGTGAEYAPGGPGSFGIKAPETDEDKDTAAIGIDMPDLENPEKYLILDMIPQPVVKDSHVRKSVVSTPYTVNLSGTAQDIETVTQKMEELMTEEEYEKKNGQRRHLYWDHPTAASPHRKEFKTYLDDTVKDLLR